MDELIKESAHQISMTFPPKSTENYKLRTSIIVVRMSKNSEILVLQTSKIFSTTTSQLKFFARGYEGVKKYSLLPAL